MKFFYHLLLIHEPLFGAINNSKSMEKLDNYLIHIGVIMLILGLFAIIHKRGKKRNDD